MTNLVGQTIRGYKIVEHIGSGGFGVVYRALQSPIVREVAIKVIRPERAHIEGFIKRFDAEAQLVALLEHPFIVPLYEYWRDDARAYLVMRWLKGGSLRAPLEAGPLASAAISKLIEQIGAALTLAHKHEVVHRDLKPGNILLDRDGNYYLTDFGIAKDLSGDIYESSGDGITGSPAYISPEQGMSEEITHLADIYSFGVLTYELLTGQHPFPDEGTTAQIMRHISDPLPSLADTRPDLPQALNEVIQTATEKKPENRYPSIAAFSQAYQAATEGRSLQRQARTSSRAAGTTTRNITTKKFPFGWAALITLTLLAAGVLLAPALIPAQTTPEPTSTETPAAPHPNATATTPSTPSAPMTETFFIGQSVLGNPLQVTRIGNGDRILVLVAALHGDEGNAAALLAELTANYQSNPPPDGITLYILPKTNPDALLNNTRLNSHGVDLNRNWGTSDWQADTQAATGIIVGGGGTAPFSEPETLAVSTWLLALAKASSQPLTVLFYHAAFPPTGFIQPSYTLSGSSLVSNPFAAAYGQAYAGTINAEYSNTWDNYKITGEALLWCGENGIVCFDIELPSLNNLSPTGIQAHVEALFTVITSLSP